MRLFEAKQALDAFVSSASTYRVVRTVPSQLAPKEPAEVQPQTLFILDSSYNPGHTAHLGLAHSALTSQPGTYPKPYRLILLFSVHNATKSPGPAAFEQRIAMMVRLAEDLIERLPEQLQTTGEDAIAVDVALTDRPFYMDKTTAIEESGVYNSSPSHVHLVGFDTTMRIFDSKYYKDRDPPLSALNGYFEHHGFRVMIRPDEGQSDLENSGTEEQQRQWLQHVANGSFDDIGAKREWTKRIELVDADEEGLGVSSTAVRKAAKSKDWEAVRRLCPPSVAQWIEDYNLYQDD